MAAHWDGIAAADFFTAEVLTTAGLVRYFVFFVVRLDTRRVEIAGQGCALAGFALVHKLGLPGVLEPCSPVASSPDSRLSRLETRLVAA